MFLLCNTLRMPNDSRELERSFRNQILKRKESLTRTTVILPNVLRSSDLLISLQECSSINFSAISVEIIKRFSN